jgi:recombination protein RecT
MAEEENKDHVDLKTLKGFSIGLKNYHNSIKSLLQNKYGISPEEFYITCINAVKRQPKLLQCDPRSLFGAILLSAEVGLKPNTAEQDAFIIPYGKQANFQIGYKGFIKMMYRSPRVSTFYAEAVFSKDEFDYAYGLHPYLDHKPCRDKDRGRLIAVYAVCKLKDGDPIFSVVEGHVLAEIEKFSPSRDKKGAARNNGKDIHDFMEIKAAVKKISRFVPTENGSKLARAIDIDGKFEGGASVTTNLLTDGDDIAEATILDHFSDGSSMENAFDSLDTEEEPLETPTEEKTEPPVEEEGDLDFATLGSPVTVEKEKPKEKAKPKATAKVTKKKSVKQGDKPKQEGGLF